MAGSPAVFAQPRDITDLRDCYFYHTLDVPGHGLVRGPWDLRSRLGEYLGGVDVRNKRVLDLGTASGFLAFSLEQQGANVIAYDLSDRETWDMVPVAGQDLKAVRDQRSAHIRQLNNGFWLCHRAFRSNVKLAHGTVYAIPRELGEVDVSILGCILLHVGTLFLRCKKRAESRRKPWWLSSVPQTCTCCSVAFLGRFTCQLQRASSGVSLTCSFCRAIGSASLMTHGGGCRPRQSSSTWQFSVSKTLG